MSLPLLNSASRSNIWSELWKSEPWYELLRSYFTNEITPLSLDTLVTVLFSFIPSLLTVLVGSVVAWVALKQARIATQQANTAAQQAEIARSRHEEQTRADLQRRVTENFTKAVEQLGSEKLQVRLGGIYTLERVSRESELDYWPIMETLTGFVRERARWKSEEPLGQPTFVDLVSDAAPQQASHSPPTDVAAVLTIINRRDTQSHEREKSNEWFLDLSSSDLRGAHLPGAHLEGGMFDVPPIC